MRTLRFFTPQPLAPHSSIELDQDVAHHIFTVLRLREETEITIFIKKTINHLQLEI